LQAFAANRFLAPGAASLFCKLQVQSLFSGHLRALDIFGFFQVFEPYSA
jgi:hypothetical protein